MIPLPLSFYQRDDVQTVAKELIGKTIYSLFGEKTGGIIIETEAYAGVTDRASHAYNGRRTARTEVMYGPGGYAYVYFCYGMHFLLNAVTASKDTPHAVLIRAIEPMWGIEIMLQRRNKKKLDSTLCFGPGALCKALGITKKFNGHPLNQPPIQICEAINNISEIQIKSGPRIGVDYAGPDAKLPYRFERATCRHPLSQ
jgi:DNA-3-methyladenine glycosylase